MGCRPRRWSTQWDRANLVGISLLVVAAAAMWTIMLTVTAIASVTLVVVDTWTLTWLRPKAGSSQGANASKVTR